jgi:hypothetical protein
MPRKKPIPVAYQPKIRYQPSFVTDNPIWAEIIQTCTIDPDLCDDLHFRWHHALTLNKTWNCVIGERESGKTVASWLLIWNAFLHGRPSLVLRRRIADITCAYIDDAAKAINKFLRRPIQFVYLKGDVGTGIADVRVGFADQTYTPLTAKKLPLLFRIIGLSVPMSRIKSNMINDVAYIFFDEFICNLRGGEKYLAGDELFLIQEIFTTYNREASRAIRIIMAGNPYSVYNPIFMGLGVNTALLKPGAYIVGPHYSIDCFQVPPQLKEQILRNNPMYQFDDSYKRYAFNGEAINDTNIRIHKTEPAGFKLKYVFKMGRDYLSLHQGIGTDQKEEYRYWACKHDAAWIQHIGKRRNVVVFNFQDMVEHTVKFDVTWYQQLEGVRDAINKRRVTYNCIDASYMLEDVYNA